MKVTGDRGLLRSSSRLLVVSSKRMGGGIYKEEGKAHVLRHFAFAYIKYESLIDMEKFSHCKRKVQSISCLNVVTNSQGQSSMVSYKQVMSLPTVQI